MCTSGVWRKKYYYQIDSFVVVVGLSLLFLWGLTCETRPQHFVVRANVFSAQIKTCLGQPSSLHHVIPDQRRDPVNHSPKAHATTGYEADKKHISADKQNDSTSPINSYTPSVQK